MPTVSTTRSTPDDEPGGGGADGSGEYGGGTGGSGEGGGGGGGFGEGGREGDGGDGSGDGVRSGGGRGLGGGLRCRLCGGDGGQGGAAGEGGGGGSGGGGGGSGGDLMSTASTSSQPFTLVWILTSFTSTSPARLTSKASPQTVVSVPDHAVVTAPDGSINSTVVTNGALNVS